MKENELINNFKFLIEQELEGSVVIDQGNKFLDGIFSVPFVLFEFKNLYWTVGIYHCSWTKEYKGLEIKLELKNEDNTQVPYEISKRIFNGLDFINIIINISLNEDFYITRKINQSKKENPNLKEFGFF